MSTEHEAFIFVEPVTTEWILPVTGYSHLPMRALISFEAAARHESFKGAAAELNVTPAAISHQIKALEHELRGNLFQRLHRRVELTEKGAYLLVAIQGGFDQVSQAMDQLKSRQSRSAVTIHSTTAVSSLWLTPRLAEFWKSNPDVSVSQVVSDTDRNEGTCDLSIHYGDMSSESAECMRLFNDRISALASPEFARKHPVSAVSDLASVPLIQLRRAENHWTTWEQWAEALGYCGPLQMSHFVNNYVIALQAARDGMGAVLGWEGLTANLTETGTLVRLLPESLLSPLDFYVARHNHDSSQVDRVIEWLSNN
ncbi:LysR substrate-binding domain-containing protein [Ruegeria sp. Ofav3-42]|uniref:LysR substrate-binding domain-containing protein n=1 Tax=Ruegeria sp. Ofav3-42 TaxID=2917759 RepID=UPI001EF58F67|nr:LysR substrate-binding domain-containing protein [Ruegeria sp. Ofav3-42]MCG7522044.1 LysR substrate-binding domain-containing protein [Ruegeria sp. Ofav3-42]